MGRTSPPEDGRPTPPTPWELRCLDSFSPEKRRLADSPTEGKTPWKRSPEPTVLAWPKNLADWFETHRGPWPWVGHHPLKTAGPHPQAPGSCAASTHFPLKNEVRFARNSLGTSMEGPLKTAGPCPQPPELPGVNVPNHVRSLTTHRPRQARAAACLSQPPLKNEGWPIFETHRGPWPWVGHHPLKTAGPHPQPPGSCAASTHFPLKNEGWPIRSKLTGDLGDDEGSIP